MMFDKNFICRVEDPWIYIGIDDIERQKWIPSVYFTCSSLNLTVRIVRGNKMRTTCSMMDEISAALQFFEDFGENWYALKDCLESMHEWLPGDAFLIVVTKAEELLSEENPDNLSALLLTLHEVGQYYSISINDNGSFNRNKMPFHVLFLFSTDSIIELKRMKEIAKTATIPFRE